MTCCFTVYGLRLKGDRETRYIGHTRRGADFRFAKHLTEAKVRNTRFASWLNANRGSVEVFPIAKTDDYETSRATEKLTITLCVALGQRLFNKAHMPALAESVEA